MPRKAFTQPSKNQSTLSFDVAESGSSLSVITPISDPSPLPKRDETILTVSELDARIKAVLDCDKLTDVTVTGEITGFRINASGHYYFSLTEKAEGEFSIPCVIWKYLARKIPFEIKNGISVNLTGYVDFYPPSGKLQFIVKKVEPALMGKTGLYLQKEKWKKELEEEGIIPRPDAEKRFLPVFPKKVGVVTSKTGSVLQDIRNVISRRFPVPLVLAAAQVQGAGAEKTIVSAINSLQGIVDVIIVARGGGSFEDLFVFNHPDVVRAIRYSETPIITAIGHETDTTLADFASDLRVPTPSAAAETVVRDRSDLYQKLEDYRRRIYDRSLAILKIEHERLDDLRYRVDPSRLTKKLDTMHQQTAELHERITSATKRILNREHTLVSQIAERLITGIGVRIKTAKLELATEKEKIVAADPKKPLERGYAMVRKNGAIIRSKQDLNVNDLLNIRLADGDIDAKIEKIL